MRRRARTDANQAEIVAALRAVGCTVAVTSSLGGGFPDLVVGYKGRNWMLEVKDGSKPPSACRLTPDEMAFHLGWRGDVVVVKSVQEALAVVGVK